jgi:uncharacterized membrane protein
MQIVVKTAGWLVVSGTIIFTSNIVGGADFQTAIYGAAIAKIGTTVAYFFYELFYQRVTAETKGETKYEVLTNYTYNPPIVELVKAPCV